MSISYSLATSSQFYINVKGASGVPTKDSTGGSTLMNVGNVTLVTDVTRGNVLAFSGTAYLDTNYLLPLINTRLFWVNFSAFGNNIISSLTRPLFTSTFMRFSFNYPTSFTDDTSNPITLGVWYLYALTYDGTTAILYRNGNVNLSLVPTSVSIVDKIQIGAFDSNYFLKGYLDNIRCYNTALTQQQIQDIYNYELANPTSFYYENGYTIPPSIGFTTIPLVAAIPQAFNTVGSNTLTVTSYTGANSFQNGIYTASASSVSEGKQAWNMLYGATSKSINDYWHCAYAPTQGGYDNAPYDSNGSYIGGGTGRIQSTTVQGVVSPIGGEWVQIQLPYKLQLSTYSLYTRVGENWSTRRPTIFYVVGSNDGSTWYQVDYRTLSSAPANTTDPLIYTTNPNTGYRYFRLITNAVNAGNPVIHYRDWTLTGYASGNDYSIPPSISCSYIVNPNGLAVYIDFTNPSCYPGSGTTFYNLMDGAAQAITIGSGLSARVSYTSSIGLRLNNSGISTVGTAGVCLSLTTYTVQTISIWYKIYSINNSGSQFLCDARTNPPSGSGLTSAGYVYYFTSDPTNFGSAWNTAYVNGGSAIATSTATWTGVVNPTTPTPWRNVTLVSSSSAVTYPTIAGMFNKNEGLDCAIAFVLVYNRALSQEENAKNYNSLLSKMNALS